MPQRQEEEFPAYSYPSNKQNVSQWLPWVYWGFAAFFFFAEYFVRVSPGVMANDLMREFKVGATQLSILSSTFYITYLGMQIPVGALVDRYGPRLLLSISTGLCAIASYWFAQTHGVFGASVARFVLGFGSAFAFVGALKLAATWLPARYLGLVVGITQGLGMLGASVGEYPMAYTVSQLGWRTTMYYVAILFVCLSLLIAVIVRNRKVPSDKFKGDTTPTISEGLKIVLSNKQTWINATFCSLIYAPTALFGELWGVKFITGTSNLSLHQAASCVGMIFIGWTIGGPLAGWISDRIKQRRPVMFGSCIAGLIITPVVIYFSNAQFVVIATLMLIYGLTNGGLVAAYAVAAEINPKAVTGISLGFTNMASVLLGACLQPIFAIMLEIQWDGKYFDGVPFYSAHSYQVSMLLMPLCFFLGIVCLKFIRETGCENLG